MKLNKMVLDDKEIEEAARRNADKYRNYPTLSDEDRDKVKQRGEDYEHDNRCACPEAVRRTHLRTLARESIEDVKILIEELRNNGYEA